MMKVLVESPFAGKDEIELHRNLAYARAAVKDCLLRREAPYASHLFFTQPGILDDRIPSDRKLGIEAGLVWGEAADKTVVYIDLGVSSGMKYGIQRAIAHKRPVEERRIPGWSHASFNE